MTTDLSNKSVKQLRRMAPGHDDLLHDCVTGEAADELAHRLEEAQQRLKRYTRRSESGESIGDYFDALDALEEAQQQLELYAAEMSAAREAGFYSAQELWSAYQTVQQRNAAHDAKVAAEAKAEALEAICIVDYEHESGLDCTFTDRIRKKAAEYRAEAGRKE